MTTVFSKSRLYTLSCLGATFVLVFAYPVFTYAKEKITQPIADGMVLNLEDNLLQQVSFRARSFGPGLCRTDITLKGSETIIIAASPHGWSDWHKTSTAYSGGSHRVSVDTKCDTGSMIEGKFSRK